MTRSQDFFERERLLALARARVRERECVELPLPRDRVEERDRLCDERDLLEVERERRLLDDFFADFPLAEIPTPARRAFESPIAIACFRLFTGCLPRLACSISSRTNSPAWVVGFLPSRSSFLARSSVVFAGMFPISFSEFHQPLRAATVAIRLDRSEIAQACAFQLSAM